MTDTVATAYSATGSAWAGGPARVYDRLAATLVDRSPVPLVGRRVLDVGAGTGSATRAVLAAGAGGVVAVDVAHGMLAHEADERPPAVLGDARALPFDAGTFGAAVAAFSLNHIPDPAAGLREMARVTASGGPLVAAAYAADDAHPVKAAVEAALAARGWQPEPWYEDLSRNAVPRLATEDACAAAAAAAALEATVERVRVPFADLDPAALVAWRLGMAQHAPFVARLGGRRCEEVATAARVCLGEHAPPLVRSVLVITAVRP